MSFPVLKFISLVSIISNKDRISIVNGNSRDYFRGSLRALSTAECWEKCSGKESTDHVLKECPASSDIRGRCVQKMMDGHPVEATALVIVP